MIHLALTIVAIYVLINFAFLVWLVTLNTMGPIFGAMFTILFFLGDHKNHVLIAGLIFSTVLVFAIAILG